MVRNGLNAAEAGEVFKTLDINDKNNQNHLRTRSKSILLIIST